MFIPYKKNKGYKIPVIFEFGQQNTRVGYAGTDGPEVVLPSDLLMDSEGNMKFIEQNSTYQPIGFDVKNILQGGQIVDFDIWKEYVEHILNNVLFQEKQFPFFFVENGNVKKETRNKIIEMLFEEIDVSSVFFHRNTMLAQYIVGKDNVLVVDCGASHTTITPILDGNVIEKGILRGDIGGEYITNKLYEVWKQQGLAFSRFKNYSQLSPSLQMYGDLEIVREIKHQCVKLYDQPIENLKFNPTVDNQAYELPDQTKLLISEEMYKYPEFLYEPTENFEGLDKALETSLEKIDSDYRKELVQNVILIGGASCTVNMVERFQRAINNLKIFGLSSRSKVQTLPKFFDRQHASWLGASIVASSQIYDQWTLNKSDYDEHGSSLIEKKMFY
ncbi:unnamed protein product [Paramecium octaurelia]|uniref:Actin n=1 Tax=Paramecium octaurelia TaxID=43137 RepID=A0A8S1XRR4_PAROT|nr:unnamed protein product [Paramecium octaurelia]